MKLVALYLTFCWLVGCVASDNGSRLTTTRSFLDRNKKDTVTTAPINHPQLPVITSTRGTRSNARLQYEDEYDNYKHPRRSGIRGVFSSLTHIKASILSLAIAGIVVHDRFLCTDPSQHAPPQLLILLIGAYLIESYLCSTRRYLSNVRTPEETKNIIREFCQREPMLRWDLECYHYREDWHSNYRASSRHHYSHHDSFHRHSSDRGGDKIVTHRASRRLVYSRWTDTTNMDKLAKTLEFESVKKKTFVKITLLVLLTFADRGSYQRYLNQEAEFFMMEGQRDRYTDRTTHLTVDGFQPKLLAVRTVLGGLIGGPNTGQVRIWFYWLCTLCGLTVPYRMWFSRQCDILSLPLVKQVTV